jgi:hypothetical protein
MDSFGSDVGGVGASIIIPVIMNRQRELHETVRIICLSQICMFWGEAVDSMPLKVAPELYNPCS